MNKYNSILILFIFSITWLTNLSAQQKAQRKKFYVGMETGVGFLQLSRNNIDEVRTGRFLLGFNGGYIPFPALRVGLNLNGYTIEPGNYNYPEKGIGISQTHFQIQILPFKKINLFTNVQGGWATYTNNHPHEFNSKGTSGKLGIGYEYGLGKRFFLSLIFNYCTGKFNDVNNPIVSITNQHYNSYDITTCITFK